MNIQINDIYSKFNKVMNVIYFNPAKAPELKQGGARDPINSLINDQ